jgi:sugar phosphate isomerase/epimerase
MPRSFASSPTPAPADHEAAIATAARLGASELLVAGNDPDDARQIESFGAFCELADSYGLGAVLEFMPWTEARNLTQAARIVDRCGSKNAGVLIDPFHFSRSRSRIEDIASVPALAPALHAVLRRARRDPADDGGDPRPGPRRATVSR